MNDHGVDDYLDQLDIDQHLAVDFGAELQLEIEGIDPRLPTELIGMETGKYLVVKTPTMSQLGGISTKLYSGNRVVVRYIYRGTVYGFESTIVDSIASPVQLLFLTFPKVVTSRNIRSDVRINTLLPASLELDGTCADGTITDISITGCHFEGKKEKVPKSFNASVDAAVRLMLQLPGVSGDLQVSGTVKNVRKDGRLIAFGIAFSALEESAQLAIDSYVKLSD